MKTRRAMTLIEVMIALTIAGVALAAGSSVLGFLSDRAIQVSSDATARSIAIRTSLREWIGNAAISTSGDTRFIGAVSRRSGERTQSRIDFVTTASTPVATGGDARTRIRIDFIPDATGRGQVVAHLEALPKGQSVDLLIADSASALMLRYRSSIFGAPQWLSEWNSTSVIPAVAELHIDAPEQPLLALPLTVLVGERR